MNFKRIVLCALVTAVFCASPVFALSLDEAKSQGLVGETPSGYLGAVKNQTPEVSALISSINDQRRAKYQQIAGKNGTSVAAVEALAGKKAIAETQSGHFVQQPSGAWAKK